MISRFISHFSTPYWISQIKATLVQFSLDVACTELGNVALSYFYWTKIGR